MGRWNVPLRVDGRLTAIDDGLWHADHPSIVWFWPIVVLIACVLAVRRVRRRDLDFVVARMLAAVALVAVTIAGLGLQLHGRPTISILQLVELALTRYDWAEAFVLLNVVIKPRLDRWIVRAQHGHVVVPQPLGDTR